MIVEVYKNIHKSKEFNRPMYSIRDPKTRKVLGHSKEVFLEKAAFTVQQGGRKKVLKSGRKNVHAFIRGTLLENRPEGVFLRAYYNPYEVSLFTIKETKLPFRYADFAIIDEYGIKICNPF